MGGRRGSPLKFPCEFDFAPEEKAFEGHHGVRRVAARLPEETAVATTPTL